MTPQLPRLPGEQTVTIRGLIFDYGGVLWDMRWDVTRQLEQEYGLSEHAIPDTLYGSETWRKLEVGVGDRDAWLAGAHRELQSVAGRELPLLHMHWRERQHLIVPNIDLIRRLRPTYKTAVLSNADSTLVGRMKDVHGIVDLFDDVVCSADVGLAKPDPRVYALAASRLGLQPGECVFVDDLADNVEAARAAGMRGVQFLVYEGHNLEAQLAELGVSPAG
jgi:putative hydrolase of the HAD superfamily